MKLKMQLKALTFLYNLINNDGCIIPSNKPLFQAEQAAAPFPEVLPEQEGIRSAGLLDMFAALSADRRINPHSAVVIRNGKLIAKADWEPYSVNIPHVSHSLAKSVTGMATGIAVNEKYLSLDETIGNIFNSTEKSTCDITVRDLLIMSSGVKFNEAGSLLSKNWIESFLASDVFFEHGTAFHYNSMNSYMLSAAICKRTGLSLSEYLSGRLFSPLGINNFFWEKCPSGIEKGGWGLYLNTYEYAMLGQLWLQNGTWNGTQLIPHDWITNASSRHITHKELCVNGYGYQVWLGRHGIIFSGMFGQLVYIIPRERMVIALTAGSENLFPCGFAIKYIEKFLDSADYFSNSPFTRFHYSGTAALRKALSSAKFNSNLDISAGNNIFRHMKSLFSRNKISAKDFPDGIRIEFEKNNAHLLPLLIQVMEGCFGHGIEKINFIVRNEKVHMQAILKDEVIIIPLGIGNSESFSYNGYNVSSQAFFTADEDDLPVLKVQLCFVETSCTKILKFIFTEEGVTLKIRENPKLYNAIDEVALLTAPQLRNGLRKTLEAVLETDIAEYKIKSFIEPTLKGKCKLSTKQLTHS